MNIKIVLSFEIIKSFSSRLHPPIGFLWNDDNCLNRHRVLCKTSCTLNITGEDTPELSDEPESNFQLIFIVATLVSLLGLIVVSVILMRRRRDDELLEETDFEIIRQNSSRKHPIARGINGKRPSGLSIGPRSFWGRESIRTFAASMTFQRNTATTFRTYLDQSEMSTQISGRRVIKVPWVSSRPVSGLEEEELYGPEQVSL